MSPVRILIADDHELVRRQVRTLLEGQTGLVVCGEADTGRDAVAMAVELRPDVVVLDLSMPDLNGLEVMREIRRAVPARIVVLSAYAPDQFRNEVLAAGGDEYVFKGDAGRTLVDAIHALLDR